MKIIEQYIKDKRIIFFSLVYAVAFSTIFTIGGCVESRNGSFSVQGNVIFPFFVCFIATMVISVVVMSFLKAREKQTRNRAETSWKSWVLKGGIIFLCWIPYLLIFYPGNLSADSGWSLRQILGEAPLNNAHPIFYTGFVGIFIKLGLLVKNIELGIALYSIAQMLILAFVFAGIIEGFKVYGSGKISQFICTGFFALNPLIAMYSITMWKDILFSLWILVLVCFLYFVFQKDSKRVYSFRNRLSLGVLCLLIIFGRNNGIYIVLFVFAGLFIYSAKKRKKLLPLFCGVMVVVYVIQGPVYSYIGIQKGSMAESLAIPLQQIGYTVKNDGNISSEQKEFLEKIIPLDEMKEAYIPYSANGIKFHEKFDNEFLKQNLGEFLKVWAQMLPSNLGDYIKAYLIQTSGYWNIRTSDWRCVYGVNDVPSPEIESVDLIEKITGVSFREEIKRIINPGNSKFWLFKDYMFYSIGASVWLVVFAIFYLVATKKWGGVICLTPLIGNWATIMLAVPTYYEFRYMFCFHIAIPIVIIMLVSSKNNSLCSFEKTEE